jgi:ent-kaurene oxidase
MTIVALRMVPCWTRPIASLFLPCYWRCRQYIKTAQKLLGPRVQHFLEENDASRWIPDDSREHTNVLSWLIDSVKGKDRNPNTLAHVMVILALASVHTVLLRIVNVLYDLTAHPEVLEELRDEIFTVAADSQGWGKSPYDRLHKLDSVLVESQRTSPPTTTGIKRLFMEEYTFTNGLRIPKGAYVCMPIYAIENDPENTANPEIFDGLRQYRASGRMQQEQGKAIDGNKSPQFTSPTPTILNFGYGKAACPGRFFAGLEIKMVLVKLLTEYEFQFIPGTGRPSNMMLHEFLFTWPWTNMLIRRRKDAVSIF